MARFVPVVDVVAIAHPSEQLAYRALEELPDGYVVLHSFPWLRPLRDVANGPLREGEADFVVLHPQRGLLVVEVKGGHPSLEGRTWMRSGQAIRDPFEQARRNRYALLDAVEERTRRQIHRGLFAHGDAVVFPHSQYDGRLPLNAGERIFIDARGLTEMATRIEAAFAAWSRGPTRLSPSQFVALLDALMPKLRLLRCVGAEIASERQRIVQITLDQRATLSGLMANDRVLVEGVAGSGKTLLALEFAMSLAQRGEQALLLCFNHNLAAWLQEQAAGDPRARAAGGRLEISTFHAFALGLARRAGVEFDVPRESAQEFWNTEVPLILEQAIEVLSRGTSPVAFDAVVVDEAQDFAPDWWVTIESLTRRGRAGRLYAFLDLHQSLRGDAQRPPVPMAARFSLLTNCRNTQAVARSAASLAHVEMVLLPGSPRGELPATRRASSESTEAGIVLGEVRRLMGQGVEARQLVLLGPATYKRGLLARFGDVDGVPLIEDASDWRRGGGVLVSTARSFKGLQADFVVLYGANSFGPLFTPADLYVGWTRARHRLIVVSQAGKALEAVEAALADAQRALEEEIAQA